MWQGPSARLPKESHNPGPARPTPASQIIRPDRLNPQSQSLSRSYGSNLPISLTYILLSTRGCSPRRPDADIGTNRRERPKRNPPTGFSRASRERPRTARKRAALRDRLFNSAFIQNPLAPRRNSRVSVPQAEKKTLPGVLDSFSGLCRVTATE